MTKTVIPQAPNVPTIIQPAKYEVLMDDTFKIEFSVLKKEKRWIIVEDVEGAEKHFVEFRIWRFEEMLDLKKKATIYDQIKRTNFIDHDIYNQMKLRLLIRDWSFSKHDDRYKLFHVNNYLSDQSWDAVRKLHPNIITYIIDGMNNVLEYGV